VLQVRKTSFPFRAWMAVRKAMPPPWNEPRIIEKRLKTMNLCRFFWDMVLGALMIGLTHLTFLVIVLVMAPVTWGISIIVLSLMLFSGVFPSDGFSRVNKAILEEDESFPINRLLQRFLLLGVYLPVAFLGIDRSPSPVRPYRTLTIFGWRIYPYHVCVPALLYLIVTNGVQAYHTNPNFAHSVIVAGWVLGIIVAIVALISLIVGFSKSETGKVFRAYLRAKKQRVCPMIEFVDK
jgi:hypothetical protein